MISKLEEKFNIATKNILLNNLKVNDLEYIDKKIVFVYDLESKLSQFLANWYINTLKEIKKENKSREIEIINFEEIEKNELKDKLLTLQEWSTVVLVQSTNFRLDDFRIRLNLHNSWVGCLEHNHLKYTKDNQIENYADAIEFKTPYYKKLSNELKQLSDNAETMTFICNDWSILKVSWWFEDMKQNTWDYTNKNRWGTFPIWENFTEAKKFENVNWELSVYAFPWEDLQLNFTEPFKIKIEKSIITYIDENAPQQFKDLINKIIESEDHEVMVRELWFWLNNGISKTKQLSDVNAYERVAGFHMSLWKKTSNIQKKNRYKNYSKIPYRYFSRYKRNIYWW